MTHRGRLSVLRSILIPVVTIPALTCADTADDRSGTPPIVKQPALVSIDTHAVQNATYMSQFSEAGFVTLTAGVYESDEPEWRVMASLDEHVAIGDLDGNDTAEAAVVIWTNTGGTGAFVDLAVLEERDGQIVNIATRFLGDRLRIHSLSISDRVVELDATIHTPDDPMCCPSLRVKRRFRMERGSLIEDGRPHGAMDYGSPNGDVIE
ncbi:MAG: hypothetical protein E4H28_02270 [Gemmatimonadales bacterium]|nr:MAG: hypothetical protein E4H28_02270 [Gemmatimonadales bacterium]